MTLKEELIKEFGKNGILPMRTDNFPRRLSFNFPIDGKYGFKKKKQKG